jgi:4-amino-4-deoxychorismate lyase
MISRESLRILVDGEPTDRISCLDRGMLYGDGIFETIAVEGGRLRFWMRHLARLQAGCLRLGIPPPDGGRLLNEARLAISGVSRAVLKIIVTRGAGGRGYRPAAQVSPTRIIQLLPWPDYADSCRDPGVAVRLCRLRLGCSPRLAGIKHLNRLEQVLARSEWDDPAIPEGLLLDADDHLVEGTMSNLFLVRNDRLLTPELTRCGVAGVVRTVVMELAGRLALPTQVKALGLADLWEADEVFLTNSVIGIWPVVAVDGHPFRKGDMTHQLQLLLAGLSVDGEAWLN